MTQLLEEGPRNYTVYFVSFQTKGETNGIYGVWLYGRHCGNDRFVGFHSFLQPSWEVDSAIPTEYTGSQRPRGWGHFIQGHAVNDQKNGNSNSQVELKIPWGPHQIGPPCVEFFASNWATNPTLGILIPAKSTAHVTVPIRMTWGSSGVCWLMSNNRLPGDTEWAPVTSVSIFLPQSISTKDTHTMGSPELYKPTLAHTSSLKKY